MNITEMSDKEIFNREALLSRLGDDEELASEVLSVYLEDTPVQIASLKTAYTNKDKEKIVRQGHTIKGASSNVSAIRMCHVAYKVELAGKNGELDAVSSLVAELEEQFRSFQDALSK